jgi:hypothetical protein
MSESLFEEFPAFGIGCVFCVDTIEMKTKGYETSHNDSL